MAYLLLLTVALLVGPVTETSQRLVDNSLIEQTPLQAASVRDIEVPPFTFHGSGQCDDQGNLYFLLGDEVGLIAPAVMRLADSTPTLYRPSFTSPRFSLFYTNPKGDVWILTQLKQGAAISTFGHDGVLLRESQIALPANVDVREFVVTASQNVVIGGFFTNGDPVRQGKWFAAIFDQLGRMIRYVPDVNDSDIGLDALRKPHDTGMSADANGNIYMVVPNRIFVFRDDGSGLRSLQIDRPRENAIVTAIEGSPQRILLQFVSYGTQATPQVFSVIDSTSGKTMKIHELAKDIARGGLACMRGKYTFVQSHGSLLRISTANQE